MQNPVSPATQSMQPLLPFIGGAAFDWQEGIPTPRGSQSVTKTTAEAMNRAAAGLPYPGEWDSASQSYIIEPRFAGCTVFEVALMRRADKAAAGDTQALSQMEDRLMGKPKQAVESVNVGMSLTEYLRSDQYWDDGQTAIDVTATPAPSQVAPPQSNTDFVRLSPEMQALYDEI